MITHRQLASFLVVSGVALAACGGSDEAASSVPVTAATTETVEPSTTEPAPVETEPAPVGTEPAPVETEPAPTTTDTVAAGTGEDPVETDPAPVETDPAPLETDPAPPTTGSADGADASCLIGDWVITEDELNAYYDAVTANIDTGGPPVDFEVAGQTSITFTENEYVYTGNFDLMLDIAGTTTTAVSTGTVSGTWEAVDGVLISTITENDLDIVATAGGVTIDGSQFADGLIASAPINEAPFDCAGPTLGFQAGDTGAVRHDVLLTPA